jgi:glycosyltransferase involved in cell wall biosynthesis
MRAITDQQPSVATRCLVIIPAYDEEAALPSVLAELAAAVPEFDVVVVSDGSRDATAAVGRAAGVHVLELPYNLGIGAALQTGFRFAARHGYDRAIQFDADGQHDPGEIGRLLAGLDRGGDLVIGSRFAAGDVDYRVGATRSRAMALIRFWVRVLSGRRFTDTSSGFRGFSRDLISFFADSYPAEYMESVEALLLALRAGFNVIEIPVAMRARQAGTPSNRSLHLAYHFVRLAVVLVSGTTRHRPAPRGVPS